MIDQFETREAAAEASADLLAAALRRRLGAGDEASLVVAGGSTPGPALRALGSRQLSWERVHVMPSDERWVSDEHEDSNAAMIRDTLLAAAPDTRLTSLYAEDAQVDDHVDVLDAELRLLPFPFAAALLGMGEDGHFASLFPDADNLETGLDVDAGRIALAVRTAASPHPRISLTLAALSRSDLIVLLIFGAAKLNVVNAALEQPERYPVGALLRQKRAPVRIVWAA